MPERGEHVKELRVSQGISQVNQVVYALNLWDVQGEVRLYTFRTDTDRQGHATNRHIIDV
jgi:hypothetical protein